MQPVEVVGLQDLIAELCEGDSFALVQMFLIARAWTFFSAHAATNAVPGEHSIDPEVLTDVSEELNSAKACIKVDIVHKSEVMQHLPPGLSSRRGVRSIKSFC